MGEVHKDFICNCGEEKVRAEEVLAKAKEQLEATDKNLLSAVVYSLDWNLSKSSGITGMECDQWARVTAETYDRDEEGEPLFRTSIQCDLLEHGIAATWLAFHEKFPLTEDEDASSD